MIGVVDEATQEARAKVTGFRRQDLYQQFHRLTYHMTNRLRPYAKRVGYDEEDLAQTAWIGVMLAWLKYEPGRETKFTSYVASYIGWVVKNELRMARFGPRDPVAFRRWTEEGGGQPRSFTAMQMAMNWEETDPLPWEAEKVVSQRRSDARRRLRSLVRKKTSRRDLTMCIRYYLLGQNLEEVGRLHGVSRERVRQIIQRALPGRETKSTADQKEAG